MEAIEQNVSVLSNDHNLHTSRNPHAFVSRLPTEILQDIFIHCARDYLYRYMSPTKFVPSWVNVSYVCRHWRNVALESPTLWTYIFIISQRWTEVLLARSKQASLKIRVNVSPHNTIWLSCVGMVMNHVERIQELLLYIPVSFDHQALSKLSSRAPRLQNLDITIGDSSVVWPSLLFDGDPPALRKLRLESCSVPLHSFRLNTLTVLHLVDVPVQFQQNMEEFLSALSCMQDLEHLYLWHALPSATGFLSGAVFKTFQKIDLTHLSRLWIRAPLSTTVTLLSCINIPLETQVRLECDSEPNPSLDHYTLLRSLLAQKYKDQAQTTPAILALVIRFTEGGVMLTFSPRRCDNTYEPWNNIHLYIKLDILVVDKDAIVDDICSSMPLSNVQTLSVIQPWFSPALWRRILRQLQDVRYVKLSEGRMPDLSVLSLTDHTTHNSEGEDAQNLGGLAFGDRGQSHILAPRLEELVLKYITFLPGGGSNLREPAITRSCLFDALSTRQGPPGQLTIIRSNIPGSGAFNMVAVWGDDGFHVVSEKVYTPELDWGYGYDDDDESVHSPEVDSDSDLDEEEEEESVHSPEVDSDLDLEEEEEESVHSFEGDASDWGDDMDDSGYSDDG